MQREIKKYLFDILQFINSIQEFTKEIKSYSEFKNNNVVFRAAERELEIIGKLINRIKKTDSNIVISNSSKIIALRNRLAHDYENINDDIIWGIIKNHLSPLKSEIENLLTQP